MKKFRCTVCGYVYEGDADVYKRQNMDRVYTSEIWWMNHNESELTRVKLGKTTSTNLLAGALHKGHFSGAASPS